jgi:hypothetical protein
MKQQDRYVIKVDNPEFDGIRCGVRFDKGRAVVTDKAIRDMLVLDHGYKELQEEQK